MELEDIALLGAIWLLGIIVGWGFSLAVQIYNDRPRVFKQISLRDAFKECDTCGQISSTTKGGLCDWCQKVYAKTHSFTGKR